MTTTMSGRMPSRMTLAGAAVQRLGDLGQPAEALLRRRTSGSSQASQSTRPCGHLLDQVLEVVFDEGGDDVRQGGMVQRLQQLRFPGDARPVRPAPAGSGADRAAVVGKSSKPGRISSSTTSAAPCQRLGLRGSARPARPAAAAAARTIHDRRPAARRRGPGRGSAPRPGARSTLAPTSKRSCEPHGRRRRRCGRRPSAEAAAASSASEKIIAAILRSTDPCPTCGDSQIGTGDRPSGAAGASTTASRRHGLGRRHDVGVDGLGHGDGGRRRGRRRARPRWAADRPRASSVGFTGLPSHSASRPTRPLQARRRGFVAPCGRGSGRES